MIPLLITYLLFQITYDQWGDQSELSTILYFTFQWLWVALVAFRGLYITKRKIYLGLGLIFSALAVNELCCIGIPEQDYQQAVGYSGPVFGLTIIALALFTTYEIIRWKRKSA